MAAFEVPTVSWDVTPLIPVNFNRRFGETLINFYRFIRRHIPEGNVLQRIFVGFHLSYHVGYSSGGSNHHTGDFLFFKRLTTYTYIFIHTNRDKFGHSNSLRRIRTSNPSVQMVQDSTHITYIVQQPLKLTHLTATNSMILKTGTEAVTLCI
jgi:hypothetical protein